MDRFYHQFKSPVILQVSGKDSERYLQARLTNNFKKLQERQFFLAACLTPQGKTKAVFRVYRQSVQEFLLFCLAGNAEEIHRDLGCFIVADRVQISNISDYYFLYALSSDPVTEPGEEELLLADPYLNLSFLLTTDRQSVQLQGRTEWSDAQFLMYRLKNQLPEFPSEVRVDSLFPESGMSLAISNTKGCYAGQEVVERVIALGKLPAMILAFRTISEFEDIDAVQLRLQDGAGSKAGEILNSQYDPEERALYLLARVSTKFSDAELSLASEDPIAMSWPLIKVR